METLSYLFFSLIQSATEFLPVSSSGHLLFFKGLLHRQEIPIVFDIVVHVGSLVAILIYYFSKLLFTFGTARTELVEKRGEKPQCRWLVFLIVSTAATFVFFLLFKKPILSMEENPRILLPAYLVTTVILFSTVLARSRRQTAIVNLGWGAPLAAGLFQGLAILPGISRSGSTLSSLLYFGARKEEAAYYTFSLAVPAVLGALAFKLTDVKSLDYLARHWILVLSSFAVSVVFSFLFLVVLNWILRKGKFWVFGLYTFAMAVVSGLLFNR